MSILLWFGVGTALAETGTPASARPSRIRAAANHPRHPEPLQAIAACQTALHQFAAAATFDGWEIVRDGCSQLYAEPACRDAMRRRDQVDLTSRLLTQAQACRTAYCRLLPESKPSLCKVDLHSTSPSDPASLWREFNQAVFAFDLGLSPTDSAQTAALVEVIFRPSHAQVSVKAPPAAESTVQLHLRGSGSKVEIRIDLPDSQQREVQVESPLSTTDQARIAEMLETIPKSTQIVLAEPPSTLRHQFTDLLEVLHGLGYKRFALTVRSK